MLGGLRQPQLDGTAVKAACSLGGVMEATQCRPSRAPPLALAALAVACACMTGRDASAAAFQLKENSALDLGNAFAGAGSAADSAATVFNNPAGMVQLPGLQVAAGASLLLPSFKFRGTARDAFGRPISGESRRDGGHSAIVPYGHVSYRVTPELAVGLSLTSPFGLATYYNPGFVGRFHADKSDLKTFNVNPAVAYQVTPWLSVGVGFSAMYARAEFASSINSSAALFNQTRQLAPLREGFFRLRGEDYSFGYNLGVLLQPGPATKIGLSYRSRMQQNFEGTVTYDVPAPLSRSPTFRNGDARAKLTLPDSASIGITQGIGPDLTVHAEFVWTNWSQFKNLSAARPTRETVADVPQRYDNSYFVALGANYRLNDALTLRAGTAFDKSPVSDDYRTARVPDENRVWLALGASYQVLPGVIVDAGYAHLFVKDSSIRETSPTRDVLTGRFRNRVDIISLGTRTVF